LLRTLVLAEIKEKPFWDLTSKIIGAAFEVYFADIVVDRTVVCEIKAVTSLTREHEAQLIHYLTATKTRVGLLINFGARSVQVKRMIL
jgi:GxxExxY protein